MTRRQDRVADLIRQEVSEILLRDVQDPRARLASVSQVRMTPDLKRAMVGVSVLGSEEQREEALKALRSAQSYIRRRLASKARQLRSVPELTFELDRGAEHSQNIADLLEQIDDPRDST